jgi:hypothetical protein
MLKKNAAAGRYDSGTRGELAKLMTDDLLAVHKDGHLHVLLAPPPRPAGASGEERRGPPANWPPLIQSAKTIAPGIGYVRFTAFMGTDEEMAAVRKWLAENRDDKVLIFDLRNHHGGGLDEQDAIFSYLYSTKTPLENGGGEGLVRQRRVATRIRNDFGVRGGRQQDGRHP